MKTQETFNVNSNIYIRKEIIYGPFDDGFVRPLFLSIFSLFHFFLRVRHRLIGVAIRVVVIGCSRATVCYNSGGEHSV